MPLFQTGSSALLSATLGDGNETKYLRAYIYRNGTQETAIAMAHDARGRYTGVWTPATSQKYNVIYVVYEDAARTIESLNYERVEETWQSVDGAIGPGVADAVWDEPMAGHTTAGSAGEYLIRTHLIEALLRNRLELADGDTDNWILYKDDGVTPWVRFSVTDKDGEEIKMDKFVPARRTGGIIIP